MNTLSDTQRSKKVYQITLLGGVVNVVLAAMKGVAGVVGNSGALIADAVHSLSDLASDVVVILFLSLGAKPKDDDHNYGHGKYETLATTIIGLTLAVVAYGIFHKSVVELWAVWCGQILERPAPIALIVAALSIVSKELLYHRTLRVGRDVQSAAVMANAWHHRTDALSSVGTLLGVGCAYFLGEQWRIADPIAALCVAVLIFRVAYQLVKMGVDELLERSLSKEQEHKILSIVCRNKQVLDPHNLRTRRIGNNIAVEVHIRVEGSMSVSESHLLTEEIERNLAAEYGQGCIVGIHVEPKR